ncbi:MAG: MerR family transcriptional regulator [Bacteroidaceae bacterium]|nr:MerR family transcriptional regulator [Bacteroidaceae bacterium]
MAYNPNKELKKYYSIKEVSDKVGVPETTLRYWEKEFKELSPKKTSKGIRQYTVKDIELVELISFLVKDQGLTISGAKTRLKENPKKTVNLHDVVSRLQAIRSELLDISAELDSTPPCGKPL